MNVEIRVQIFSMALVLPVYMSIVRFEALEQTLRLRVVSGPVDKKFFFSHGE